VNDVTMRARTWTGGAVIAMLAAIAVAAVVTGAGAREEVREIHLVARGMTFYLDSDQSVANPTIVVNRNERVRLVLRNETPGIDHDLAIASLAALPLLAAGQTGVLDLLAPASPGRYEYHCRPHAAMMKGVVEVR
jgi:Cupredoxin-like domain